MELEVNNRDLDRLERLLSGDAMAHSTWIEYRLDEESDPDGEAHANDLLRRVKELRDS